MSKFLINLFIRFGKSESLRKAALNLLKDLAQKSDNDVDDAIVKMIEEKIISSKMKITKFLNIDIEPAPPELELEIEMQCREIMKSNDLDNVKRYCTHMVRKKFDQDVFLASLLNRLIELEANRVVVEMRKRRPMNPIAKFFSYSLISSSVKSLINNLSILSIS